RVGLLCRERGRTGDEKEEGRNSSFHQFSNDSFSHHGDERVRGFERSSERLGDFPGGGTERGRNPRECGSPQRDRYAGEPKRYAARRSFEMGLARRPGRNSLRPHAFEIEVDHGRSHSGRRTDLSMKKKRGVARKKTVTLADVTRAADTLRKYLSPSPLLMNPWMSSIY